MTRKLFRVTDGTDSDAQHIIYFDGDERVLIHADIFGEAENGEPEVMPYRQIAFRLRCLRAAVFFLNLAHAYPVPERTKEKRL